MLSMGPVFDLAALKMAFASLVRHAEPSSLPSFMLWVDLRVSEFKVTGTLPPALSMDNTMNMIVDDIQKKCCSLDRGDTAETCGTQTSPTSQASSGYVKNSRTDPRYFVPTFDSTAIQCSVQTMPTDLSVRREPQKLNDVSPKNSLKNVIDNIVKKEALSEVDSKQWSSHMSLPVVMPPAANTTTEQHTNLARLLSNPLMPNETSPAGNPSSISPKRPEKHHVSQLEDFPHKKFRPDISVPSQQAGCLKENGSEMSPLAKDQFCSIKSEPVSPEKNELQGKQNGGNLEGGLPSPVDVSPLPNKASALRELLTNKHSSQQNDNELVANQYTEKLIINEECAEFDHDVSLGSVNEDDIHDKSRHLNTCHVCGQSFHYRSSFRRHMKVHQGIFSHVCAVCGRKFTRKEHFIRHKCSRKPNKASRGAHVESSLATGITPKVEFPPTRSPDQYREDLSSDHAHKDLPITPVAGPQKLVHMYESRRKATVPRKVVMVEEYDPDASFEDDTCEEYSYPECAKDKVRAVDDRECPSPAKPLHQANSPSQHERKISLSPKKEVKMDNQVTGLQNSCTSAKNSDGKSATTDNHLDTWSADGCSGVLDLSCPQVSSSCSPPQLLDHHDMVPGGPQVNYNMVMPTQQEFTIETGSYKVVTGAGGELEEGTRNKFIKVVKQGNYLKLKEEAQIIGGQLCFVCPTCSKIFHRSSNFSRHMRIHRGVYSYVCPNCQRGFFRREHFQKHKCSRRGMSHTWDRKTKIDMVLAANESLLEGSDAEGGSERADSEESYALSTERLENH